MKVNPVKVILEKVVGYGRMAKKLSSVAVVRARRGRHEKKS